MSEYHGICRGGPLDNRGMIAGMKLVEVKYCDNTQWVAEGALPEFVPGFYSHVLGQWIWHPPK